MSATILDGTRIAQDIRGEVAADVKLMAAAGVRPGLAVVLVGHNPASEIYVRGKVKACEEVGLYSEQLTPPESATTAELLAVIEELNRRDDVDGILVQLPLPAQVDAKKVLMAVDPAKDVDGFHPMNVGLLSTQRPGLVPCTPAGVMEILKRSNIPVAGREAVVVGRSDIVGKPAAMLLLNANATVTVCHSKTHDLPAVCRRADILVAAIGRAGMITRDFVKAGAAVIDVGMNTVKDAAEFQRFFGSNPSRQRQAGRKLPQAGIDIDGRRASRSRGSRGRHYAGSGGRWPADHRHADVQHRQSGEDAAGKSRAGTGESVRINQPPSTQRTPRIIILSRVSVLSKVRPRRESGSVRFFSVRSACSAVSVLFSASEFAC